MTNTAGYFGIPKIEWGDNLENTIYFDYPLYDWVTRSEALDGSQFLRIESGYEDSWIVNISYVLEATVRFITQEDWDDNWLPFLEWARQKNQFRFYSNQYGFNTVYYLSYLVEPITEAPTIEPDGTRTIRLVIRNSSEAYEISRENQTFQSGSYPTESLVFFVNNSTDSYPGAGGTWYDVSGNNIDLSMSGSLLFNRNTGFTFTGNAANGFFTTAISSSLGSYWPANSPVTSSLTMIVVMNPSSSIVGAPLAALWDGSIPTTGADTPTNSQQRYKFILDINDSNGTEPLTGFSYRSGSLEAAMYITSSEGAGWRFDFTTVEGSGGGSNGIVTLNKENIILWEISGSYSNVYKIVDDIQTTLGSQNIAGLGGITAGKWFGADPRFSIGASKNTVGAYANSFRGKIRAVALYNRLLTDTEKNNIISYLTTDLQ